MRKVRFREVKRLTQVHIANVVAYQGLEFRVSSCQFSDLFIISYCPKGHTWFYHYLCNTHTHTHPKISWQLTKIITTEMLCEILWISLQETRLQVHINCLHHPRITNFFIATQWKNAWGATRPFKPIIQICTSPHVSWVCSLSQSWFKGRLGQKAIC